VTTRHKETGRLRRPARRHVVISETCVAPPAPERKGDRALIDRILQHLNQISSSWELAILQMLGRCKDPLSPQQREVLADICSRIQSGVRA
jgi:hypothetical protein